jgi:hypothetical protein
MLTRRTFIQSAGALAAGAAAGVALPEPKVKEHGLVELRARLFNDLVVVRSTIFADERRDVFGIRFLGERGPRDVRLVELQLSAVAVATAVPETICECPYVAWTYQGEKEGGLLDLMGKDGNLLIAGPGQIKTIPFWMSLADVRRVL